MRMSWVHWTLEVLPVSILAGADPGFWERGGLLNIFTTWGRVREGACPLP